MKPSQGGNIFHADCGLTSRHAPAYSYSIGLAQPFLTSCSVIRQLLKRIIPHRGPQPIVAMRVQRSQVSSHRSRPDAVATVWIARLTLPRSPATRIPRALEPARTP